MLTSQHTWPPSLAFAAVVAFMIAAVSCQPVNGVTPNTQIEVMANCGTSMTITVTCLVSVDTQQVLDLWLVNADGQTSSVCDIPPDIPGVRRMRYDLAPGDSIYSVQACYRGGSMVGVTFSSAGGPLTCGNPQDPEAVCRATTVGQPSPLAAISGQCSGEGIIELTRVCFNPFFVNPIVPITGCGPGQGRATEEDPCTPCARNYYNPGSVRGLCLPCPPGLVTIAEGASECGCPPGFGANANSAAGPPCVRCSPGTYSPGGSLKPCWRCRGSAYLTSPEGASSIVQCVCRPGYGATQANPNTCVVCPRGYFSDSLAEMPPSDSLDSIARFPPGTGKGKGKGGCYHCNPTFKACTPCCEANPNRQFLCAFTTRAPGARSFAECNVPVVPQNVAGREGSNSSQAGVQHNETVPFLGQTNS